MNTASERNRAGSEEWGGDGDSVAGDGRLRQRREPVAPAFGTGSNSRTNDIEADRRNSYPNRGRYGENRDYGLQNNARQQYNQRQRQSYHNNQPPVIDTLPRTANLKQIILKLASSSSLDENLVENLGKFATPLTDEIKANREEIAALFVDLCCEYSEMLGSLSTLAMLLNKYDYVFGRSLVELMGARLQATLRESQFEKAEKCLVAISSLAMYMVSPVALITLYELFVEVSLQQPQVPGRIADWYMYIVLASLPYAAPALHKKKEREFQRLLDSIEDCMSKRTTPALNAVRVFRDIDSAPLPQEDVVTVLWDQIRDLKLRGWNNSILMRPYEKFDMTLSDSMKQNLPTVVLPPLVESSASMVEDMAVRSNQQITAVADGYPLPTAVFRIFDESDVPEATVMPRANSIERFLIEENLRRMIRRYHLQPEKCARVLLDFPEVVPTLPLDYIILEVVLGEMLRLPSSQFPQVCYYSILFRLCDQRKDLFPESLAFTIDLVFQRLDSMNSLAFERFVKWFAWHLSQYNLKWRWNDWANKLGTENDVGDSDSMAVSVGSGGGARAQFIHEVFHRTTRLLFYELLVEELKQSTGVVDDDELNGRTTVEKAANGDGEGGANKRMKGDVTMDDVETAASTASSPLKLPNESTNEAWNKLKRLLPAKPLPNNTYEEAIAAADMRASHDDDDDAEALGLAAQPSARFMEPKLKSYLHIVAMMREKKEVHEVFEFLRRIDETGQAAGGELSSDGVDSAITAASALSSTEGSDESIYVPPSSSGSNDGSHAAVIPPLPISKLQVDILINALFSLSQHTFTHLSRGLQKYAPALKQLGSPNKDAAGETFGGGAAAIGLDAGGGNSEEAGWWLLDSVGAYWMRKPQSLAFVLDRMLRCNILEPKQIVHWLFAEHMRPKLIRQQHLQPWELIDDVIIWQMRHVQQIEKDAAVARARLHQGDELVAAGGDAEMQLDDAAPPTEEMLERMEERVGEAQAQQRELFMLIFQRLILIINTCRDDQLPSSDAALSFRQHQFSTVYLWMLGRLQALLFKHKTLIIRDLQNLDQLLFNKDVLETEVYEVWKQFKLLL